MRVLVTGGAGFVGSHIALAFGTMPGNQIVVLDNLRRRGSELNVGRLKDRGIEFIHGDIRVASDLTDLDGNFDLFIEASAEPSVHAGREGSPSYVLGTNLCGTINCLEFARKRVDSFIFLSTSRVYSITPLREIKLTETPRRFELASEQVLPGITNSGIAENFPTDQARSLYGATKLASELLIQEYASAYGLKAIINRCGVIAGPGQFGRQDQGIISLWVAHHYFGMPLKYTGFGGTGKQVRDLLHPADLSDLLQKQVNCRDTWCSSIFNVGGGREISVSLRELTDLCRDSVCREVEVSGIERTEPVDVPLYLTDYRKAAQAFDWRPRRDARTIVAETAVWLRSNEKELGPIFRPALIRNR